MFHDSIQYKYNNTMHTFPVIYSSSPLSRQTCVHFGKLMTARMPERQSVINLEKKSLTQNFALLKSYKYFESDSLITLMTIKALSQKRLTTVLKFRCIGFILIQIITLEEKLRLAGDTTRQDETRRTSANLE